MPSLCHGTDAGAGASAQRQRNAHRRYLNGPGRPPISGFCSVFAALRCSSTHVRSAPVLAKASPKPELDGRRPRLRYRGWRNASPYAVGSHAAAPSAGRVRTSPDPAGPGELASNAAPASSHDKQKNPDSVPRVGVGKITRQRPTLPQSSPCSTIGSDELNFRVRDGIGCGLVDIATGNLWASKSSVLMLRCATRRSAGRVGSRGLRPASPAEPHLARTSSSACSARTPNTNLHVCLSE